MDGPTECFSILIKKSRTTGIGRVTGNTTAHVITMATRKSATAELEIAGSNYWYAIILKIRLDYGTILLRQKPFRV